MHILILWIVLAAYFAAMLSALGSVQSALMVSAFWAALVVIATAKAIYTYLAATEYRLVPQAATCLVEGELQVAANWNLPPGQWPW